VTSSSEIDSEGRLKIGVITPSFFFLSSVFRCSARVHRAHFMLVQ
jgi:hypothetical protein